MHTDFGNPSRCSAAGVTTAALLIVMLVMGASNLFTPDGSTSQVTAGANATHVAQSQHASQARKS